MTEATELPAIDDADEDYDHLELTDEEAEEGTLLGVVSEPDNDLDGDHPPVAEDGNEVIM